MEEEKKSKKLSRRTLIKGAAAIAGVAILPRAVLAQQAGKVTQAAVQYQTSPKNGQKCSECQFFEPPGSCKVVEGKISPNGWCTMFTPKTPPAK